MLVACGLWVADPTLRDDEANRDEVLLPCFRLASEKATQAPPFVRDKQRLNLCLLIVITLLQR